MKAFITVGEHYDLAWWIRPQVAKGSAHWYHFKVWDPEEIDFTKKDFVENYDEVYEVFVSNITGKPCKRRIYKDGVGKVEAL